MGCSRNFTFNISRLFADFVQRGKGHLFSSIYKYFYNVPRQSTAQHISNDPFLVFGGGGGMAGSPLGRPVQPVGAIQTNQATSSVPKFVDLCGRRHPVVNNFPLSHVIFKVNFALSNDPLA